MTSTSHTQPTTSPRCNSQDAVSGHESLSDHGAFALLKGNLNGPQFKRARCDLDEYINEVIFLNQGGLRDRYR
jgi:hypothetical protein